MKRMSMIVIFMLCYFLCGYAFYKIKKDIYPELKMRKIPIEDRNRVKSYRR